MFPNANTLGGKSECFQAFLFVRKFTMYFYIERGVGIWNGKDKGAAAASTQPPTVVCKNEAQLGYTVQCTYAHFIHFFCTFGADLHAQSVLLNSTGAQSESLLRVCCWLGSHH